MSTNKTTCVFTYISMPYVLLSWFGGGLACSMVVFTFLWRLAAGGSFCMTD